MNEPDLSGSAVLGLRKQVEARLDGEESLLVSELLVIGNGNKPSSFTFRINALFGPAVSLINLAGVRKKAEAIRNN